MFKHVAMLLFSILSVGHCLAQTQINGRVVTPAVYFIEGSGAPTGNCSSSFNYGVVYFDHTAFNVWYCANGGWTQGGSATVLPTATSSGQVLTSTGAGTTYTAQTPATGLPTATTAGQVPTSTGAGTTYTAQTPSLGTVQRIDQQVVAGATTTTITFSSIPQTFSSLRLDLTSVGSGANDNASLTFNGDTGAHYAFNELYTGGGFPTPSTLAFGNQAQTNLNVIQVGASTSPCTSSIDIYNYTSAIWGKNVEYHNATAVTQLILVGSALWSNIAPLTSITITISADHFVAGSIATLYGIS